MQGNLMQGNLTFAREMNRCKVFDWSGGQGAGGGEFGVRHCSLQQEEQQERKMQGNLREVKGKLKDAR